MRKSVLLLTLVAIPLCAQAQVYRWVDDKGKVHYGDRPIAKEASRVRGLIDPTAVEPLPKPGMKAADVRTAYGDPERIQKFSTRNGETEIWTFRKSKRVQKDFVAKIEGGEVVEVATDTAAEVSPQQRTPAGLPGSAAAAADAEQQRQQAVVREEAEQRERRCASLRENVQRVEAMERRGGSAASMDSLREQKRQYNEKLWSQGCGS